MSALKIVIIHLSDLHIADTTAIHMGQVDALVHSLAVLSPFEGVLIAFSGDIVAAGKQNQYKLARRFVGALCKAIGETFSILPSNIKVLIAPGNHDMDRSAIPQATRDQVEAWHKSNELDQHSSTEIQRMRRFYDFANSNLCFLDNSSPFLCKRTLSFSNLADVTHYIEVNIFNTALFSSDDDTGVHHMPDGVYDQLGKSFLKNPDLTISIMHHSPEWFWPQEKVRLEGQIYRQSNVVLYGHEHYSAAQQTVYNHEKVTFVQDGGVWWEPEKGFSDSSYYAATFDTETRMYTQFSFHWDTKNKFYEHSSPVAQVLPRKEVFLENFQPRSEFIEELTSGGKQYVCSDFTQYFVFPTLTSKGTGDYGIESAIESENALIDLIEKTPQIMITGESNTGKSTLLNKLFLRLSQKYIVLLCGTEDIAGKKQHNILESVFSCIYGSEPEKYKLFQQQEKKKKIILIDDADKIKKEHLQKLLQNLGDVFEHIVFTSQEIRTFDVRQQIASMLNSELEIFQLQIAKFYADKRYELIRKVVPLLVPDESESNIEKWIFEIDKALSMQTLTFKLDPDFIVQFVIYYCAHRGEIELERGIAFSKVFEASVELSIQPHLNRETIGQVRTALSEVAYYAHANKMYPLSENDIDKVVKTYADRYDEDISTDRFLAIVQDARLMRKDRQSLKYYFKSKDYLAYFAASALSRRFNEGDEAAKECLTYTVTYSCFSINSLILKYIAYSTENIRIIEQLMQQATEYVSEWPMYNIDVAQFPYLKDISADNPNEITSRDREREIKARAEAEEIQEEKEQGIIATVGMYDYQEDEISNMGNQFIRALLQMRVIASALPIFSHIMPAATKHKLISLLYEMPNKLFFKWADNVNQIIEELVDEFSEQRESDTNKPTAASTRKIKGMLQHLSVNLLLNLYYAIACDAITQGTIRNVTKDEYGTTTNHILERLMFYEEVDDWATFIREAESIYHNTDSSMVKRIVKTMVWHIITWSPSLPSKNRHHLMDTFQLKKNAYLYLPKKNV